MVEQRFHTLGVTEPDAWDCEPTEYICCIEQYDGKVISHVVNSGDGWYDIHFPDGHEIPGVAGAHIHPMPDSGDYWGPGPVSAGLELSHTICTAEI
jgi:hypothetical protein